MADLLARQLKRGGLQTVDLVVAGGEILCIHGASGSGKSLLLRALADLDPNTGEVSLGETKRHSVSGPQWRRRVMYVPPEAHWWLETVGPHAPDWPPELLSALGFEPSTLDWEITRLSTGERQRLAIARALARNPDALLLDEPTANLDPQTATAVEQVLVDYCRNRQAPLVWVSHDPAQRERIADCQREMQQGRLI